MQYGDIFLFFFESEQQKRVFTKWDRNFLKLSEKKLTQVKEVAVLNRRWK